MLSTWIQSKKDEEGFTLIELLVVVIIIGILAAIAIPVFLNQRENAWRGSAESDARNAAIEIESHLTRVGTYPAATFEVTDGSTYEEDGMSINVSDDVTLTYDPTGGTDTYSLYSSHANVDGHAEYDAGAGGLQDWSDSAAPTVGGGES